MTILQRRYSIIGPAVLTTLLTALSSEAFVATSYVNRARRNAHDSPMAPGLQQHRHRPSTLLRATDKKASPEQQANRPPRPEGVYVRPSAAVERGSGFFIPGLQGPRLRLLTGTLGLVLAAWNHYTTTIQGEGATYDATAASALSIDEVMAVVFSLLVLLQGAIEAFRTSRPAAAMSNKSSNKKRRRQSNTHETARATNQVWSVPETTETRLQSREQQRRIEWATQAFLALTPASCIWLLSATDGVLFQIEKNGENSQQPALENVNDEATTMTLCRDSTNLLAQSSTGRLSLPSGHPVSESLLRLANTHDTNASSTTRTVVLQRIDDQTCLAMTSSELLVAFRKQDLSWLGQMAKYVAIY